MDFDTGGVLEAFERHFGHVATRILLSVIALAITGFCLGVIFHNIVFPIYRGAHWLLISNHYQVPPSDDIISALMTVLLTLALFFTTFMIIIRQLVRLRKSLKFYRTEIRKAKFELSVITQQIAAAKTKGKKTQ